MSGLTYVNQTGAVNGINQAGYGVTIPDTFVRWAQDVLFDRNGLLRRRAPFSLYPLYNQASPPTVAQPTYSATSTLSSTNERVIGVAATINPVGDRITAITVTNDTTSRILFYDASMRGSVNTAPSTTTVIPTLPRDCIFDFKQANTTGMWLSFLKSYASGSASNDYVQYYWRGGCGIEWGFANVTLGIDSGAGTNRATYNSTITASPTTQSGQITAGTFSNPSNLALPTAGMFVYRNVGGTINATTGVVTGGVDYYIGTIVSASSTTLTLEKNIIRSGASLAASVPANAATDIIKIVNVRPFIRNHARGLISGTPAGGATLVSGNAGTDAEGHWNSAKLGDGTWELYRASDGAWLGHIASVTDNTTLVLDNTGTPYVPNLNSGTFPITQLKADEYIARPYNSTVPSPNLNLRGSSVTRGTLSAGIFNAVYAGYQWYGNAGDSINRNRIVFSSYLDPEGVDLSANDADSIIIPSLSEMRGMASSSSGLVIFMADKTFIIRGNSRFNFSLEELYPEGCLSSMSIVEYGGGVYWASKTGLFYFDGSTVINLTKENLALYYGESVKAFNPQIHRAYGFFHRDYLFMHFNSWNSTYTPVRYEPVYAGMYQGTSNSELAIQDFDYADWDSDFTIADFNLDNNTPIYWTQNKLYTNNASASNSATAISWQQGVSFVNATTTSGSNIISGLVANIWATPFITNLASTTTTTTITIAGDYTYNATTNPNGLQVNSWIRVVGVTPAGHNGTYRISSVSYAGGNTLIAYDNTTNSTAGFVTGAGVYVQLYYTTTSSSTPTTYSFTGPVVSDVYATTGTSGTGTAATINVAKHSVRVAGEYIMVTGVTPTAYNGVFPVTSWTSTSITYTSTATGAQTVAGNVYVLPHGPYLAGMGIPNNATAPSQIIHTTTPTVGSGPTYSTTLGIGYYLAGTATSVNASSTNTGNATIQFSNAYPTYLWGSTGSQYVWGPLNTSEGITFAIYLPTNAITVLSNFHFRGAIKLDSINGLKALMGANIVNPSGVAVGTYPRLIDVDSIFNLTENYTDSIDPELIENLGMSPVNYIKGPDFYVQTKHYNVGDPLLKKWFRQLFLNLYLTDGALRMDIVDNEDNDAVNVQKKTHKNWEVFTSVQYTWSELETLILPTKVSPNRSTWTNVQGLNSTWFALTNTAFERRKKRVSWRYPSLGFRIYQLNNYRPYKYTLTQRPYNVMLESWDIGFKPMRASRT